LKKNNSFPLDEKDACFGAMFGAYIGDAVGVVL